MGTANVYSESVDAKLVAKLLGEQIEAIGPELVVQVVSDNTAPITRQLAKY